MFTFRQLLGDLHMFRSCLLVMASLVTLSGTASAGFYNYGGYHHSYSYSYSQPRQSYGNVGYGAVRQVQYLVPVTYRVPIFIQRPPVVVQAPVIQYAAPPVQYVQPACPTQDCCHCN